MVSFSINSEDVSYDGDPGTPLLWVIRDHLQMRGTKFGCGIGQCGACTVHVDGAGTLHPVQQAWLEHDVPQCGYCQAGQIMAAVDFLKRHPQPTDADIDKGITNICRCGTYVRIRKAIHRAAELTAGETS